MASEMHGYSHSEENIAGVESKTAEQHVRRHGLPIGELHCGQSASVYCVSLRSRKGEEG
jgi:hypothetical protein